MLRADPAGCAPALRLCRALLTPGTALGTTAWVALRARPPKHWRTSFCAYLAESTKIAGDDADRLRNIGLLPWLVACAYHYGFAKLDFFRGLNPQKVQWEDVRE